MARYTLILSVSVLLVVWSAALVLADDPPEPGKLGEVTVLEDPQNIVASELMGSWKLDTSLTGRMSGTENPDVNAVVFRPNEESKARMEAFLLPMLSEMKNQSTVLFARALTSVYLVGEVELSWERGKTSVHDFMLIVWRGNPCLILYDRAGDIEMNFVGLARDKKGDGDLLLVGGDFNNQSFYVFVRADSVR